ncbi:MAG: hypothetical protein Phog2KO_13510 [Phototrophicaceae bacterium]
MPRDIICDMSVFTEKERIAHQNAYQKIFTTLISVQELETGYAFQFPLSSWQDIADYIPDEARCCPFFDFTLELRQANQVWWTLSGTDQVKSFLKDNVVKQLDV